MVSDSEVLPFLSIVVLLALLAYSPGQNNASPPSGGAIAPTSSNNTLSCQDIVIQRDYYRNKTNELRKNVSKLEKELSQCRSNNRNLTKELQRMGELYSDKSVNLRAGNFNLEMENHIFLATIIVLCTSFIAKHMVPSSLIGIDGLVTIDEELMERIYNGLSRNLSQVKESIDSSLSLGSSKTE